jgi:glycosyltransferase involved in cell wall biosynthesis
VVPTVVHLHWLEYLAPADRRPLLGGPKTAWRALRLMMALADLRRRGIAIVWTIHNLAPHEPVHPWIEQVLARGVLATADRAIVHSDHAKELVAGRLGFRGKLHTIAHGNYRGVYPPATASRADLRHAYGVPEGAYVYLSFGQIRAYKRLPELIEAFRALPAPDAALLIAGEPRDLQEARRIRELAASDERVILDLRRIPRAEVSAIHGVADAAVFPYRDMFSSGSAMLALSCSLPIVVPADSTGTEIASGPAAEPIVAGRITAALSAVRLGDQAGRQRAAREVADRHDWGTVGEITLDLYRSAQNDRRARRRRRFAGSETRRA